MHRDAFLQKSRFSSAPIDRAVPLEQVCSLVPNFNIKGGGAWCAKLYLQLRQKRTAAPMTQRRRRKRKRNETSNRQREILQVHRESASLDLYSLSSTVWSIIRSFLQIQEVRQLELICKQAKGSTKSQRRTQLIMSEHHWALVQSFLTLGDLCRISLLCKQIKPMEVKRTRINIVCRNLFFGQLIQSLWRKLPRSDSLTHLLAIGDNASLFNRYGVLQRCQLVSLMRFTQLEFLETNLDFLVNSSDFSLFWNSLEYLKGLKAVTVSSIPKILDVDSLQHLSCQLVITGRLLSNLAFVKFTSKILVRCPCKCFGVSLPVDVQLYRAEQDWRLTPEQEVQVQPVNWQPQFRSVLDQLNVVIQPVTPG